jgi:hypothetical protein
MRIFFTSPSLQSNENLLHVVIILKRGLPIFILKDKTSSSLFIAASHSEGLWGVEI